MRRSRLFIASSSETKTIAEAIKAHLEPEVEVNLWFENQFGLNKNFLEELLRLTKDNSFFVAIAGPDDEVTSRGKKQKAPRDNVIFELGLFMGSMGSDRAFLVHADNVPSKLKIASDLFGISLLKYDYKVAKSNPAEACRAASYSLKEAILKSNTHAFVGKWHSKYLFPYETPFVLKQEMIEISTAPQNRLAIESFENKKDPYKGGAILVEDHYLAGEWQSTRPGSNACGGFILKRDLGDVLYGLYSGDTEDNGHLFGEWILVREDVEDVEAAFRGGILKLEKMSRPLSGVLGRWEIINLVGKGMKVSKIARKRLAHGS